MVRFTVSAVALALVCLAAPLQAETSRSALDVCPANATLVLQIPHAKQMVEKIRTSPPGKLFDHQEFGDLFQELEQGLEKFRSQLKAELDVDLWELLDLVEGEVLFYVGDAQAVYRAMTAISEANELGSTGNARAAVALGTLPVLLVADSQGGRAKLKEVLDKVKAYIATKGVKVEASDFHGGRVTAISSDDGQAYVGEHGSRLLLGFNRSLIEQAMVHLSAGTAGGLTGDSVFQATRRQAKGGASDIFVYMSVKQITESIGPALPPGMAAMVWHSARTLLFGNSFNSMGMGGSIEKDTLRQTVFIHNDGASDGILGWFKGGSFPATPPNLVPPEAATFSTVAFNAESFAGFVRDVLRIVGQFQGMQLPDMEAKFKDFVGVGLEDLLRGLGGRMHFFGSKAAPTPDNPLGDQTFVIELKDETPFKQLLQTINVMMQGGLESKEYLGRTIYKMAMSPEAGTSFCVTDRMLVLSFAPDGLEKVVRRIGKEAAGLGDSAEFKKLSASVPSSVSVLSYSSSTYFGDYFSGLVETVMNDAPDEVPTEFFFFLTALGKTMGASIGYGSWGDSGLYLETNVQLQEP